MTRSKAISILLLASTLLVVEAREPNIAPFLKTYCADCHNAERTKGKVNLEPVIAGSTAVEGSFLEAIHEVVSLKEMPPEDEQQPTTQEREAFLNLPQTQLASAGHKLEDKAALPGHGNYVDHKLLFTEPAVRKAATPARLWRVSPHIFMQKANTVSRMPMLVPRRNQGGDGLHPAFAYMTPAHTFRDHAEAHAFEEATTELLFDVCWDIAGYQTRADSPRLDSRVKQFRAQQERSKSDWRGLIRLQYSLALRRNPEVEETANLLALALKTEQETGLDEALQTVFTAVLLKPEAVYRYEIGAGEPDEFGRVFLAPYELQNSIAYALTDDFPDKVLETAADKGRLTSREDVHREVDRILGDFEQSSPRLLTEDEFFIAKNGIPKRAPVEFRYRRDLLPDYGFPNDWDWEKQQPLQPVIGKRSGMLTHPAWLLAFSDNEKNQAIQRGRWVQMKLLGGTVPDTPIGVDAKLPTDPHLTLREKMRQVTSADYCWRCHQKMDPLGLPFEQFDDFGRYRDKELKRPVNTTGNIAIGVSEVDGPVQDPFEMLQRLANSEYVEQVFVRHAFRYFLGRNETIDDAPTLIDAHRAYRANGGSMKALVASLLTSDSFLYRQLPQDRLTAQR